MTQPLGRLPFAVAGLFCGLALGWGGAILHQRQRAVSPTNPSDRTGAEQPSIAPAVTDAAVTAEETETSKGRIVSSAQAATNFEEALRSALRETDPVERTVLLRNAALALSVDQLPVAFEKAKKVARTESWDVLSALGRRWADVDARGAVAFGLEHGRVGPHGDYNPFLQGVVEKWTSRFPDEAIAWVDGLPPGHERVELTSKLIATISRNDPRAALQLLRRAPSQSGNSWPTVHLFEEWSARDPHSAAAAAVELTGALQLTALTGVAQSWAQEDPQAAMAWASSISNGANRNNVKHAIVGQWAKVDPLALMTWGGTLTDEYMRRSALSAGISQLALKDLPAALAQIQALPAGEEREQAVIQAGYSLARTDARNAVALIEELKPGPQRNQMLASLCQIWGEFEPRAALDHLLQNSKASGPIHGIDQILHGWIGTAPDEAMAWTKALPPGEGRETALAAMVGRLAASDFDRALTLFADLSPNGQAQAASAMTSNLIQQDLSIARQWVESLPHGKARNTSLHHLAMQWAYQNPAAAAAWLNHLPASDGRDRAIAGFSGAILHRDPDGALTWALSIADANEREGTVENLSKQWLQTDAAAAREWISASSRLSAEQKRRILDR